MSTERRLVAGVTVAIAMVVAAGLFQYGTLQSFQAENRLIAHTEEVLAGISNVKSLLEEAQTKARYFFLSGSDEFLKAYESLRSGALKQIERVRTLTADNPGQQGRIKSLEQLSAQRLNLVDEFVARTGQSIKEGGGSPAPQAFSQKLPQMVALSRNIDQVISEMQREEYRLLRQRRAASQESSFLNVVVLFLGSGLALLLLCGAAVVMQKDFRQMRRMNELLREKEEHFRSMLAGVRDYAIVLLEPSGTIASWNTGAQRIQGYVESEIIDASFSLFYTPEDLQAGRAKRSLEGAVQAGHIEEEVELVRRDGSRFWACVVITAVLDETRSLKGFVLITRDLSQRRQAETELKDQAQKLQDQADLLELTQDAILVREQDGKILFWNRGAENLYGWKREEAVGRSSHELLATHFPCPLAEIEKHLDDTRFWEGQLSHRKKDGDQITVASRWALQTTRRGAECRVLEINTDVTARQMSAAALEQREEQIRLLLDSTAESIYGVDTDGNCTFCNAASLRQLGYESADELLGQNMHALCQHTGADASATGISESPVVKAVQEGQSTHVDTAVFWRKDRTSFPAECWTHPVRRDSQIIGAVVTFVDITERKRVEQQLKKANLDAQKANQAKSDFLARMSHEIRTPMNSICGMADLLWDTQLNPDQREYVRIFRKNSERLLDLINDILDLSKVEAGSFRLDSTRVDVIQTVEETMELLAPRAHQKSLELNSYFAAGVPQVVNGDPTRFRQVLVNLIGNAIKFTQQGEVIVQVELEKQSGQKVRLHCTVSDTGQGIPADKHDLIFESFTQSDTSITRQFGGTGLGLAISKKIVEMMNGRIWVESQIGVGSSFHFTVEFAADHSYEAAGTVEFQSLKDLTALIVDDNGTNRMILFEALRRWGIQVQQAASGPEGLEMVASRKKAGRSFDLIFMDGRMPGMSGVEVVSHLRTKFGVETPVILMLTSEAHELDSARLRALGVGIHLSKPIRRARLLEAVLQASKLQKTGIRTEANRQPATSAPVCELRPKAHILLAEDSPDNVYLIKAYLKDTPYVLQAVETGEAALRKAKERRYDLILMDVQMPGMDGYSATRAIRQWELETRREPMPIVALTAHALTGEAVRSLEAGCTGYLSKPIAKSVLLDSIRRYVSGQTDAPSSSNGITPKPQILDGVEELTPNHFS